VLLFVLLLWRNVETTVPQGRNPHPAPVNPSHVLPVPGRHNGDIHGPLGSGLQTGSYSITPGQNALTAQSGGAQTNAVLLTIVAGHSYTVTFNPGATFSQVTVTLAAVN